MPWLDGKRADAGWDLLKEPEPPLLVFLVRAGVEHIATDSAADGVFVRVHFQQGAAPIGVRRGVCLLLFDLFPFSFVRRGAFSDESSQVRNAVLRIEVHENYCAVTNRGLLARIGAREYASV